jgi:hypothetical protein
MVVKQKKNVEFKKILTVFFITFFKSIKAPLKMASKIVKKNQCAVKFLIPYYYTGISIPLFI